MNAITPTKPARATESPLPLVFVGHVDHGKSTLVGRILHDTGAVPESRIAELKAASDRRGLAHEWSFLLDALQIERDQGITLDTTQVWFRTKRRTYRAIDAPGHVEFVRNMATGASAADAAVLVVDAKLGIGEQTRRHAAILDLLGLRQVVVAVNKMDLVGFDADAFARIEVDLQALFDGLGFAPAAIVPLSARSGENVAARGDASRWYAGPTLLETLDGFETRRAPDASPLRIPVQDVYRKGDRRYAVGRVEGGRVRVGDGIRIVPGGRLVRVAALDETGRRLEARAGESVEVAFDSEAFVERGAWLTHPDTSVEPATLLGVRLLWLDSVPLQPGRALRVAVATAVQDARVARIGRVFEAGEAADGDSLGRNGVAFVELRLPSPLPADRFVEGGATGRGVVLDGERVVGGFVVERTGGPAARGDIHPPAETVGIAARARANGHRGGVFWLTGLSGAGKSTLAAAALRHLFEQGRQVQLLDGDALRDGLNADLGFSPEDRLENVRRTAHVARLFAQSGAIVFVALISPLREHRELARRIVGPGFHEIHVSADIDACRARDPKGLYARATRGEIPAFTGVSAPYEVPEGPDLAIDTVALPPDTATKRLVNFVEAWAAVVG